MLAAPVARAQDAHVADVPTQRSVVPHVPGGAVEVELAEGDELRAATCGLAGATFAGDTTLALIAPDGERVAFSDDACFSLGSSIRFVVPPGRAGRYAIRTECYGSSTCGGALAIEVGAPTPGTLPPPVRIAANARAVLGVEGERGALVGDVLLEARPIGPLLLRIGGTPLGLGGGDQGGLASGSASLVVGFDDGLFALAAGFGISVLATRLGGERAQETPTFVTFARIGRLHLFHFEAQLSIWAFDDAIEVLSFQAQARVPLGPVDLLARGAGGHDGVALGELGAIVWLSEGERGPELGLSVQAGGAGVFHQPTCRFDVPCRDARWIVGPAVGVGLEWRP